MTGRDAANHLAQSYAKESNSTIPRALEKEIRLEERERTSKDDSKTHEAMKKNITMEELKAIKQLKKRKSPGPDNISNEMIQHLGNTALQKLLDMFNVSWSQGQVPQCWKEARMIPVLKKDETSELPTY